MSDETENGPESVVEAVEPAVEPAPEQEPHHVAEEARPEAEKVPEWGKALSEKVESLQELVSGLAAKPEEEVSTDPPGDGQEIRDESPAKKPWHKRGLL